MEAIDYWKFASDLTVVQAALLILGQDPAEYQEYIDEWAPSSKPKGYEAILSSLQNDIKQKRLPASMAYSAEYTYEGELHPSNEPHWHKTTVSVENLKQWLKSKNVTECFFFEDNPTQTASYFNRAGSCYAPKLEAAIRSWEAVISNPEWLKNKSPKQALENWLNQHAEQFSLVKEDGTKNKQGIEEIAKIANWSLKGGATKTPDGRNKETARVDFQSNGISLPTRPEKQDKPEHFDSEIPF